MGRGFVLDGFEVAWMKYLYSHAWLLTLTQQAIFILISGIVFFGIVCLIQLKLEGIIACFGYILNIKPADV